MLAAVYTENCSPPPLQKWVNPRMLFMPISLLPMWLFGLLSLALLLGGSYIVYEWEQGIIVSLALLITGIAMIAVNAVGRFIVLAFHRPGHDEPSWAHDHEIRTIERPDGTVLHVEASGPLGARTVILVHGWGVDNRAFYYTKRALSIQNRVIAWDLRGLGKSSRAGKQGYSLDAMADDLAAVVDLAQSPAVIIGHSIGGMVIQNFARRHKHRMGSDVSALVLVATTYTDPMRTTTGAKIMYALERPLFTPLMYLTIALAPVVWAMNWLSYFNGSQYFGTGMTGFAGNESRGQLDFATRFFVMAPPGVMARGMLEMFKFDETSSIGNITVPVLVVSGDRDPVLLPSASDHISSVVLGSVSLSLAPGKHVCLLERHAEFNTSIAAFIEKHAPVQTTGVF